MYRLYAIIVVVLLLLFPLTGQAQQLTLTWTDTSSGSSQEDGVAIERRIGTTGGFTEIARTGPDVVTYVNISGLSYGTQYCYQVRAFNSLGYSVYSNIACGTPQSNLPGQVINLICNFTIQQAAGPVASYNFNEGSGTIVTDRTGKGHTGTLTNTTWTTSGKYGSALVFNGTSSWMTIADANDLDLTTGMTLEAWVYPTVVPSGWRTSIAKEQAGGIVYYLHANSDTNQPATGVLIGSEQQLKGGVRLAANIWTHLAATYDGVNQRLYINGMQVASRAQTGQMPASTGVLRIGGNSVWGEYFQGRIDSARIYNRALTVTEIQGDMNQEVP